MKFNDFLGKCTACGGNWGAMILSGIKRVFPDSIKEVEEHYNSLPFYDGGVQAMLYLFTWLEDHGVIMDKEEE